MLPALNGHVQQNREEELIQSIRALEIEMAELRAENTRLKRAVQALRSTLQPQYVALQAIFGEIEIISDVLPQGLREVESESTNDPKRKVWQSWIDKFGANSLNSRMVTALLDHKDLTAMQLRVAMKCGTQSVYDTATRLNKLGLISKNGSKYSLKEL